MADSSASQVQQEAALQQFIQIASDAQIVNYTTVVGLVLLIHDIILTFPREVRDLLLFPDFPIPTHTWMEGRAQRTTEPFLQFCKAWFYSEEWVSDVLFIPVSGKPTISVLVSPTPTISILVFLALRTYALYRGQDAFYKWLIFGVLLSSNLTLFVSLSLATAEVRFSPLPAPGLTCSFTISGPPNTAGLVQFIASTYFDFVIFVLSTLRCWQYYKQGNRRLITILLKSCVLYFVFLFTTGLASLIMYKTLPDARAELKGVLINPMRTAAVIITSRMVLNIRSIVWSEDPITTESLASPFDKTTVGSTSLHWRVESGEEDSIEFDEHEEDY
ncbi:hypothetical protein MSAN_00354900 [Mycena sanguinolenta]|uniref:Uncharacterized protein n=1 Tax=Mycena sanguinolenta TaxID=230812 RepID=A0A8H6ZBZ2_9AGAR|nr:hypothetical protein MSAN_00354900 [Mycena sanguinolenta]